MLQFNTIKNKLMKIKKLPVFCGLYYFLKSTISYINNSKYLNLNSTISSRLTKTFFYFKKMIKKKIYKFSTKHLRTFFCFCGLYYFYFCNFFGKILFPLSVATVNTKINTF